MKTPLRVLLEQASQDLQKYSYPDIALAKEHLCEIVLSTHGVNITHDTIVRLDVNDTESIVCVEVSPYGSLPRSSWSTATSETIMFPVAIIDALDNVKHAKIFGLRRQIDEACTARVHMIRELKSLDDEIVDLEAALFNIDYPDYN